MDSVLLGVNTEEVWYPSTWDKFKDSFKEKIRWIKPEKHGLCKECYVSLFEYSRR